ncbi:MAG: winged helix-turn-helix domain-containing protein [Pirellulaceae bacterium]|nr:winged helix-turn-helix domain-containing protein [Pirellulaceae bacterium]
MGTATSASHIEQIGEIAGLVWQTLNGREPLSLTKLVELVDAPRDTVMQAIGWLAREDKISIEKTSRGRIISLR